MLHSTISVIQGHAHDISTDKLYQPLRTTFLTDTSKKRSILEQAQQQSILTHRSRVHSYQQMHKLGEITLIPQDAKLRRRDDLDIPRARNYFIVNVTEQTGQPLNEEQFKSKLSHKMQEIVYDFGNDKKVKAVNLQNSYDFEKAYRQSKGIKLLSEGKYNLFNMIDEPINNLMNGGPCTCPQNELIASRNKQIIWKIIDHDQHNDN